MVTQQPSDGEKQGEASLRLSEAEDEVAGMEQNAMNIVEPQSVGKQPQSVHKDMEEEII